MDISHMNKKIYRQITAVFIILSLGVGVLLVTTPKVARAQEVPVAEWFIRPIQAALNQKEFTLDSIGWILGKQIIQQFTQSIVNWINTGFNGNPAFLQNPEAFFGNLSDSITGGFLGNLDSFYSNAPFREQLIRSVLNDYLRDSGLAKYNLDQYVSDVDGFLGGDFSKGGLDGFFVLTQNANNNQYGTYVNATAELRKEIAQKTGNEILKLNWGDGFLSLTDTLGNILTPGKIIEDQLANVLGSPIRQLELADELNEIVGALAGQLVNQALTSASGLLGTSSGSGSGSSGGVSFIDQLGTSDIQSTTGVDTVTTEDAQATPVDTTPIDTNQGDNIALNKPTKFGDGMQYSRYRADLAVNGQRSGSTSSYNPDVAITDSVQNPWWQIDLRSNNENTPLESMVIYPQTNIALGNLRIFISATELRDNFNPRNPSGSTSYQMLILSATTDGSRTLQLNGLTGRYVRIYRTETNSNGTPKSDRLRLSEVEIYPVETTPAP